MNNILKLNFFAITCLCEAFFLVLFSIFLFLKSKGRKVVTIWGFLCLAGSIWGLGGFKFSTAIDAKTALFWWQVSYIGVILTPVIYFHFAAEYTKFKKQYLILLLYVFALFFLALNFFFKDIFLGDVKFVFGQFYWHDWIKNKNLLFLIFYIFFYWLTLLSAFFLFVKHFIHTSGIEQQQVKYLIIGSLIGWIGPHGVYLIDFGFNIYPFTNICLAIYPLIIGYSIIRYRLLDIRVAFTRAGVFVTVYSIVLGIPLILIYAFQNQLAAIFGVSWWIVPYFCSIALSTIGPFLYFYINERAEAKLLYEQRTYQNILKGASRGMIRIRDLNQLLNLIVRVITKTVKIEHTFIYLLEEESQKFKLSAFRGSKNIAENNMEIDFGSPLTLRFTTKREPIVTEEELLKLRDDPNNVVFTRMTEQLVALKASLLVPSFIEDRLLGILVLGEKRSKKSFSQDDINVFSVLANQAALAIENAQFYDEIKRTHEQLFQAEKMATIGTMADGLSHQINNRFHALSLIAGDSLDMLKTFDWSGCNEGTKQVMTDLKSALERIENNVLQGGEIVKGILKYSRPGDSGFESIDFKDVLNGAIEMVQYKIKLKEIDIVQNIPADLPKLHGNLTQLQEVFFNLIDNAYDAIKERQMTLKEEGYRGKIEVTADGASNSMEIRVTDNGIGVKDLDKKRLFAPFFTTKATAKKGTGLGLYVIEKIIASHNGKIDIESTYKSGTRFIIILPTTPLVT